MLGLQSPSRICRFQVAVLQSGGRAALGAELTRVGAPAHRSRPGQGAGTFAHLSAPIPRPCGRGTVNTC